jgi:DNA-binding CsgD family transcriptional regulator/tetratricopeptide (TPR) repeat protein
MALTLQPENRICLASPGAGSSVPDTRTSDLIEREVERQQLLDLFEEARAGRGATMLVTGEAGVGKTSLIRAVLDECPGELRVHTGVCEALSTPRPLGPFIDMAVALPDSMPLPPDLATALHTGNVDNGLFPAVARYLADAVQPVALVVEDLHWADGATLDLFKFLARRVAELGIVLIGSFRDEELSGDDALVRMLGEIPGATKHRIALRPLSEAGVGLLAGDAGRSARGIFEITRGNPFFVAEVLAAPVDAAVPASVRDAVLGRLARLSSAGRQVAQWVSLFPRRVELSLLTRICAASDVDVDVALDECTERGVLLLDGGFLAFRHDLARQSVADALPAVRRRRMHAAIFSLLDADTGSSVARLIHHAVAAGRNDAIRRLAPQAASAAKAARAHREAADLLEMVLESPQSLDLPEEADVLEAFAEECALLGLTKKGRDAAQRALCVHRQLGDLAGQGRLLVTVAYFAPTVEEQLAALAQARELLEALTPCPALVSAYTLLAFATLLSDRLAARHWGERAVACAQELNDPASLGRALNALGTIELGFEYTDTALSLCERGLELALEHRSGVDIASAFTNLLTRSLLARDYQRLFDYAARAVRYFVDTDIDGWIAGVFTRRARALIEVGNWAEAEADLWRLEHTPKTHAAHIQFGIVLRAVLAMRRDKTDLEFWPAQIDKPNEMRPLGLAAYWAEAAWLQGETQVLRSVVERFSGLADASGEPWLLGALVVWLHRAGLALPEFKTRLPEPIQLEVAGNPRGAANAWQQLGCEYERAVALLGGDVDCLREALAIFEQLGADAAAVNARERMRERGVTPSRGPYRRAREDALGLTARQREVFDLLIQGLSNPVIAGKLHRSARTVEHHVAAIYRKLGVASRGALMVFARGSAADVAAAGVTAPGRTALGAG